MEATQTQVRLGRSNCEQEWESFVKVNGSAMFQIALLLSSDADAAEAALIDSVHDLDVSRPPVTDDLALWERAVVMRSIEMPDVSTPATVPHIRSLLQPGLWPIMQIERCPRICFVLRTLLGYTVRSCAQMLGIEESEIKALLQKAAIQIQPHVL